MAKKLFILLVFFPLISSVSADITPSDIEKSLRKNLKHPYLFFTEEEKQVIRDRIKKDPECNDIMRKLIAEANRLSFTPVEPPVFKQEEHFYDERMQYLRFHRNAAYTLSFVYQMMGEEKFALKAFEFADAVCGLSQWVNSYHQFPIIYSRVWPWNVPDDQVNFSCDLEVLNTAFMLAVVYDWLYPALDKHQRDRIRGTLLEKAITRVRGNYEYHWWAAAYRCNWCGVCNNGLGCAALALLTEDPQLVDVVAESYNRISRMLDEIGIDGGWQEGCGYWNYAVRTSIQFADVLERLTNGKYNLFKHPKLAKNTINCSLFNLIPPDKTVNFEDSGDYRIGQTYFYNKLAVETGSKEAAWYRENLFGNGTDIFDIIWPRSGIKSGLPAQGSHHFRTIDWVVMRSDFVDPEKVVLACKAGLHDDPHHGHLDCGQFIVYWRGEGFVSEPGRASYDEEYFNEARWGFPHASSVGHNVVLVNGELQIPAKLKNRPWKEDVGGKILEFRPGENRDYTLLDGTNAYPNKELKGWRRHIILEKPAITVILDEVKSQRGAEIETRFHSETIQRIRGGYLLLDGDKGDMALIPVVENDFIFRQDEHTVLDARNLTRKLAQFKLIPYCGTVIKAHGENTVIATIILPINSESEASTIVDSVKRSIDHSGNLSLSFTRDGSIYKYIFKKQRDGLILE